MQTAAREQRALVLRAGKSRRIACRIRHRPSPAFSASPLRRAPPRRPHRLPALPHRAGGFCAPSPAVGQLSAHPACLPGLSCSSPHAFFFARSGSRRHCSAVCGCRLAGCAQCARARARRARGRRTHGRRLRAASAGQWHSGSVPGPLRKPRAAWRRAPRRDERRRGAAAGGTRAGAAGDAGCVLPRLGVACLSSQPLRPRCTQLPAAHRAPIVRAVTTCQVRGRMRARRALRVTVRRTGTLPTLSLVTAACMQVPGCTNPERLSSVRPPAGLLRLLPRRRPLRGRGTRADADACLGATAAPPLARLRHPPARRLRAAVGRQPEPPLPEVQALPPAGRLQGAREARAERTVAAGVGGPHFAGSSRACWPRCACLRALTRR